MNTSCTAAPVVVNVQAMRLLWPMIMNGTPGAVAPASVPEGVSMRARYHRLGKPKPRCGSPARSGGPDAVRLPATAHSLEAWIGCVKGSGKCRTQLKAAWAAAASAGDEGGLSEAVSGTALPKGGHRDMILSSFWLRLSARRWSSRRQLPESHRPRILPQSRLSVMLQGAGAPRSRNSG